MFRNRQPDQTISARQLGADMVPAFIIAAMGAISVAWNMNVGIIWQPSLLSMVIIPLPIFGIAAIYSTLRPDREIAEFALYGAFWLIFPVFGVRLSYLTATLAFPLQDRALAAADAALGFHWLSWTVSTDAHPWFRFLETVAYASYAYQPFVSVLIFAKWGPPGRNLEFLMSVLLALTISIAISAVWPASGPNSVYGISSNWDHTLKALRDGHNIPLSYTGIITFPSFHAIVGLLCTAAHRRNRVGFAFFLVLNACMLVAALSLGHHYLVDILGGAVIAGISFFAARDLTRRLRPLPERHSAMVRDPASC